VPALRDKRRRTDLDLFVLALVDSGVSTPYELQRSAGLSQGATVPVLRRLVDRGFLLAGKAGPRGRTVHRLTASGRQLLTDGWKELIADGPSCDLDADLRVALIALFVGGERKVAVDFLRRSAARKQETLVTALEVESPVTLPPLAHQYRDLRAESARALMKAEAVAAQAMAKALPRNRARNRKSPSKARS
jgi:DNA-binding PadR family transcriptional regulator